METFLPLLIILFLVIFPLFARRKRAAAVRQFLNRKKQNKESNEMKELAKRLIGEDCIIYTITSESGSIQGVLKEVAMLLLGCFALAEETPLLPIAIVSYDLTDEATTAALSALIEPKENALTRWERVVLSDGREAWVICQFDQTTMSNAWSRVIDAETQEVLQEDTTDTGFFATAQTRWESAKGIYALWSIQDKMLFDRLYAMAPCYGEPVEGDLTQEEALAAALNVTGLTAADYDAVGYGYIMGSSEQNGTWQVFFVKGSEVVSTVNLDARDATILLVEPDEEGNG